LHIAYYWQLLSKVEQKYRNLSRTIICRSRTNWSVRYWQITIHWYFAITEFKNCFIIWSSSLFSHIILSDSSGKVVNFFCSQERGLNYEWAAAICLQLFVGHVVGSRPMKKKKKDIKWCFLAVATITNCTTFKFTYTCTD